MIICCQFNDACKILSATYQNNLFWPWLREATHVWFSKSQKPGQVHLWLCFCGHFWYVFWQHGTHKKLCYIITHDILCIVRGYYVVVLKFQQPKPIKIWLLHVQLVYLNNMFVIFRPWLLQEIMVFKHTLTISFWVIPIQTTEIRSKFKLFDS